MAAAEPVRHYVARFLGMGDRRGNFYRRLAEETGYGAAADMICKYFAEGDHPGAVRAVPLDFIDRTSLIGPVDRIADRMAAYAEAGVTTLAVSPFAASLGEKIDALRVAARALERAGAA